MKELFDTAVIAPEPPLRPGFVEETLTRARRSRRWRRARAAIAAATCVLLVAAAVLWVRPLPRAAIPAQPWPSGPSLPDTFPPFNRLTASVEDSPPGPAIALYQHGFAEAQHGFSEATVGLPEVQFVVAGAARDVYRQIDQVGPGADHLLSPDGRRVLLHASLARELTLVDLVTGATLRLPTVEWQGNVAADIALLAWSGDGRFVAYSVPADRSVHNPVPDPPNGHLAVVELDNDRTRVYPDLGLVSAASFGPTGELALQIGETVVVTTVDGYRVREIPVPLGHTLVPEVAWSPDGALLATNGPGGGSLAFIDATSSGRRVPRPASGERCSAGARRRVCWCSSADGITAPTAPAAPSRSCPSPPASAPHARLKLAVPPQTKHASPER